MNPSAYSVHSATNVCSYTSIGTYYDATPSTPSSHPNSDNASEAHVDLSCSVAEGWTGEHLALGAWSEADQALFEAFLTAEVTTTSPCSERSPCALVPLECQPSYGDPQSSFLRGPSEAIQLRALNGSQLYPFTTTPSPPTVFPPSEQSTAPCVSQDLVRPPLPFDCNLEGDRPTPAMFRSSRTSHRTPSSCPYPSPPPEPSPQPSSTVIAWQRGNVPAATGQPLRSQASGQRIPWTTPSCISPDLIYPPAHCEHDLGDHHPTDANSKSSRASRRATRGTGRSSSSPYPSPSPEPSPRALSIVFASQRRNAPARTAAPVPAQTWQCPFCPYVQRNRRSPDLKRHIKTHTRGAEVADWVCCGVPVMSASELGVPAAAVREAEVFEFDGIAMLGGCRKAFSRRDALIRHLQRETGKCFGDAQSLYQRGNREDC